MKCLGIAGLSTVLALLTTTVAPAQTDKSSATGSGMFKITNADGNPEYRTFTFNAVTQQDNNTTGKAEIQNREQGYTTHININCLYVENGGKVARISGTVESSTNPAWVGLPVWFKVIDNGEGSKAPRDQITMVFFFADGGPACSDTSFDADTYPIEGGNVQVK